MHQSNDSACFKDLIYTRLDLPQPPTINQELLVKWLEDQNRISMVERNLHASSTRTNLYPWRAVVACRDNRWDESFLTTFPELVRYTYLFPTPYWKQISVLAQLPNKEVFLHTDPDRGLGWRIYLSHGGPKLYFQKFKEKLDTRPQTWASGGPAAIKQMCQPEQLYVQDEGCYPWALTATRAAHGVSVAPNEIGARVTMLLFPDPSRIDEQANQQLLERSCSKYSSTAIWY